MGINMAEETIYWNSEKTDEPNSFNIVVRDEDQNVIGNVRTTLKDVKEIKGVGFILPLIFQPSAGTEDCIVDAIQEDIVANTITNIEEFAKEKRKITIDISIQGGRYERSNKY